MPEKVTCQWCAELEAQNAALISKLAHIERMVVPKAKQLIQFADAEDTVDGDMPWDTVKPTRAESMRIGDESIDNIKLPKPGEPEVPF
jgi:transposase